MKHIIILNKKYSRGFTLIEMLVVIGVIIVISGVVMAILTSVLRSSTKTTIISIAQQNGNYALGQMARTIRNAQGLFTNCPPAITPIPVSTFSLTTAQGNDITYACTGTSIASDGASLLNTTAVRTVTCSFLCSRLTSIDLPTVTIDFSLTTAQQGKVAETTISQNAIPFHTTIEMRNVQ